MIQLAALPDVGNPLACKMAVTASARTNGEGAELGLGLGATLGLGLGAELGLGLGTALGVIVGVEDATLEGAPLGW